MQLEISDRFVKGGVLKMKLKNLLIGTVMSVLGFTSMADPITYSFKASNSFASNPQLGILNTATVSGTFQYNTLASYDGQSQDFGFDPGLSSFAGLFGTPPITNFSGSVAGLSFFDPRGLVALSNDGNYMGSAADFLTLNADSGVKAGANSPNTDRPRTLQGFVLGDYTLINVRIFWGEAYTGKGDFLTSSRLPNELPIFNARLAMDFVRTDDPYNLANVPFYSNTVFFDGVQVSAVPELETFALMLAGLGLVGAIVRRRKRG